MTYTNFDSMPLVLSVEDVADTLAIGRNKAYALVNTGTIKALKIGQHYRISKSVGKTAIFSPKTPRICRQHIQSE